MGTVAKDRELLEGPKTPPGHPDRVLLCEEALESALNAALDDLVRQAVVAGWLLDEAEEDVLELAQTRRWVQLTSDEADRTENSNVISISEKKKH